MLAYPKSASARGIQLGYAGIVKIFRYNVVTFSERASCNIYVAAVITGIRVTLYLNISK